MGYEIIYKTFTIKKNDVYIPMIVIGSNNCYETQWNGRQRRERNLYIADFFFEDNQSNFKTLTEMEEKFKHESIQKDMNGGMIQGKYNTAQGLINSFKKYVFDSKEIELTPKLTSLYYIKIEDDKKEKIIEIFRKELQDKKEILTETEEKEILKNCLMQIPIETREKLYKELIIYPYNEYTIKYAFKEKYPTIRKKEKSTYELNQELKDKPFKEFDKNNITGIINKTLLVYDNYKHLLVEKGKIKPLYSDNEYGFFMHRSKRRYLPLHRISYYKIVE